MRTCTRRLVPMLLCMLLLAACGTHLPPNEQLIPPPGKYDARILRDTWGVPHIFGKTDADCAYGLAYAQSEDDFETMQMGLFLARAKMGLYRGQGGGADGAPIDYLIKLFRFRELVDELYEKQLTPETRALCEAYAAGFNHYCALHPEKVQPGVLPCTGKDIVAGFVIKSPMFFGMDREVRRLLEPTRARDVSQKKTTTLSDALRTADKEIGSNTFAVGPARTDNGSVFLAINSHQPWEGPVSWYEAHLKSEEGLDITGGVFPGAPCILHGHNRNLGWAHTVNMPDLVDIYVLEINPENENQYKFDGKWRDLDIRQVELPVRLWGPFVWTVKREALYSVHGPVMRTPHGTYAIRYAGYGRITQVQQWYQMNKAANRTEFLNAMRQQGVASFNVGYADKDHNFGYLYNALLPRRAEGYDWRLYLPGNTSETLWTEYLKFDELPQVWNPQSGFIQNCNSSPFQTTTGNENPDPARYSPVYGIETHMTNRGLRALELYGSDPRISWDEFKQYKFDTHYSDRSAAAQLKKEILEAAHADDPVIREALDALRKWDLNTDLENTSAPIAILTMEPIVRARIFGNPEPDPVATFAEKAHLLKDRYGRIEIPWKEINRLVRGKVDLPLQGGPDTLRAVYGSLEDGRLIANNGDCYILLVQWDADGKVHSESIHQYGSATLDPASIHYADQAPLFARHELKPVWLDEQDIRAHLEAEYRPGERR